MQKSQLGNYQKHACHRVSHLFKKIRHRVSTVSTERDRPTAYSIPVLPVHQEVLVFCDVPLDVDLFLELVLVLHATIARFALVEVLLALLPSLLGMAWLVHLAMVFALEAFVVLLEVAIAVVAVAIARLVHLAMVFALDAIVVLLEVAIAVVAVATASFALLLVGFVPVATCLVASASFSLQLQQRKRGRFVHRSLPAGTLCSNIYCMLELSTACFVCGFCSL